MSSPQIEPEGGDAPTATSSETSSSHTMDQDSGGAQSAQAQLPWPNATMEDAIEVFTRFPNLLTYAYPNPNKRPRAHHRKAQLTSDERKNICLYAEKYPSMRQEDIARKFRVERSTVSKILKNRALWLNAPNYPSNSVNKKLRSPKYPFLEDDLIPWLEECRDKNIILSDKAIKQKAAQLDRERGGYSDFKASDGWLDNFKKRRGITKGRYIGAVEGGDISTAGTITRTTLLPNGHVRQEQVAPTMPRVVTGYKYTYLGYDLRLATMKNPPPDPEFWVQEPDDPGIDYTMDSDDDGPPGDYPLPPPEASGSGIPSTVAESSSSASQTGPHPSSSSQEPQTSISLMEGTSTPTPAQDDGTSLPQLPPALSEERLRFLASTVIVPIQAKRIPLFCDTAAQNNDNDDDGNDTTTNNNDNDNNNNDNDNDNNNNNNSSSNEGDNVPFSLFWPEPEPVFSFSRGRAPGKAFISTREAKDHLVEVLMYLDVYGRARKLCKRSQRVAIQDVLTNFIQYIHSREEAGLEPN